MENLKENLAATMLFCPEIASLVLDENGLLTTIKRLPVSKLNDNIDLAEFEVEGSNKRRFLVSHHSEYDEELSARYKAVRNIRLDAALEIDDSNNILSHRGQTSFFCALPLVGIEDQLDEPLIVNSPDFEPDSERQSLLLSGRTWNEEKDVITEVGINQKIYKLLLPIYDSIVKLVSERRYGNLHLLASGLKKAKKHKELDAQWYEEQVLQQYRQTLMKYEVVERNDGQFSKLADCIFAKETKLSDEINLYSLLSSLSPASIAQV